MAVGNKEGVCVTVSTGTGVSVSVATGVCVAVGAVVAVLLGARVTVGVKVGGITYVMVLRRIGSSPWKRGCCVCAAWPSSASSTPPSR